MFENYETMTDAEKDEVKRIHRALRRETEGRYGNLAWAFVRGFPYRRVERKTRTQEIGDGSIVVHNRPDAKALTNAIAKAVPSFPGYEPKRTWATKAPKEVIDWLASEEGAIAAPPPRVKEPFRRAGE